MSGGGAGGEGAVVEERQVWKDQCLHESALRPQTVTVGDVILKGCRSTPRPLTFNY